jgi:hypothetical protein
MIAPLEFTNDTLPVQDASTPVSDPARLTRSGLLRL